MFEQRAPETKLRSTPFVIELEHGSVTVLLPQEMGGSIPPMLRLLGDNGNYVLNSAWRKQMLRFRDAEAESERQLQQRGEAPRFHMIIKYTSFDAALRAQKQMKQLQARGQGRGGAGARIHYL